VRIKDKIRKNLKVLWLNELNTLLMNMGYRLFENRSQYITKCHKIKKTQLIRFQKLREKNEVDRQYGREHGSTKTAFAKLRIE
jgi:thermostable 8-oxoguanine DNA glycosylase